MRSLVALALLITGCAATHCDPNKRYVITGGCLRLVDCQTTCNAERTDCVTHCN